MDIFVIRLNKLISENRISKYKLAKDLKIGKATVLNWCDGKNEPKVKQIRMLAEYFGVSTDYLLGLEDEFGGKTSINNSFNDNSSISINSFNNSGTINFKK